MKQTQFPALADLVAKAHVVSLPLATKFRKITARELMLIEGPAGWSEWSPFVDYSDEESSVWLKAAIEFGFHPLPKMHRSDIPINATLPAINDPAEIEAILLKFGSFDSIKIKVAETDSSSDLDFERINFVAKNYPNVKIRLDANGAWSVSEAVAFAKRVSKFNIEYLEQPCAGVEELALLSSELKKQSLTLPIAADESIRKSLNPFAAARNSKADILILKNQPLGGIQPALEIAKASALPVVISSALESSVGISMGVHLAAALPELNFACGLGTAALLNADVTEEPLVPVDGFIPVKRVEVSRQKLIDFEADADRKIWWLERLERCYKILAT